MRLEVLRVPEFSLATMLWGQGATFAEVVAGVAAAGFGQCELSAANLADDASDGKRRRILNQHGVWARTLHSPMGDIDLSSLDEDARRAHAAAVAACLEPMAALGGFAVIVHPTGGRDGFRTEDAARRTDAFRRSLDVLCVQADQLGVRLACENLLLKHQPRPLCRMEELRSLVDDFPSTVGICLDTGHAHTNGLDPADEVRIAGDRLIALHLQDTDAVADRHWAPGQGTITWPHVLAALIEIQFRGAWTFEIGAKDAPPAQVAAQARRIADAWSAGRMT